jgi:AraC-like DNA-binding protein
MIAIRKVKDYDMPQILAAQKMIDENPKIHFKIADLAQRVGINEFKLKHGFKQLFKKGVHQYRLHIRLRKAKTLLEETDLTIAEIADSVGFESRDGFSNAFKKEFKLSPRHWRNDLQDISGEQRISVGQRSNMSECINPD